MRTKIFALGLALAVTMVLLQVAQYKLVIIDRSVEMYSGVVALVFAAVGILVGGKLAQRKEIVVEKLVTIQGPVIYKEHVVADAGMIEKLGISKREFEVLELMAQGHSNQEIAEMAFLSIHTVKTHASNLFVKLDVQRRTQAVKKAKDLGLIP
jgi:DNA-binding CsgD family transcriptional regulator